jgi:hypothetical protein
MPDTTDRESITVVNREQLEASLPNCTCGEPHMRYVRPPCHPRAHVRVAYDNGVLGVLCNTCQAPVFGVRVASSRCARQPTN